MKFENYIIRIIEKEDSNSFFNLVDTNRPRLEDFIAGILSKTKNKKETEIFIDEIIQQKSDKIYFPYVIVDNNTNELIGFFDIKNIDWTIPKAEIGYFIDKNHTGKGIAKNALNLIVTYFFQTHNFSKFLLRIHEDNKVSIKVAEKCGFIMEGSIRKDYKKTNGEIVDMIYYGKIN